MAGNGGVAVQLGLSTGNGDVVDVVDFGQLLLELVELAEVIAPAGQQGNGVGGTDQQDLGVRVQGADGLDDGADVCAADGVGVIADLAHAGGGKVPDGIHLALGQLELLHAGVKSGLGLRVLAAQVAAQHDGSQILTLPVGRIAEGHDGGHEGVVGAHLDGDDIGLFDVVDDLRVVVLAAGELVHLAHLAGLDQLHEVGAHQAGQTEIDGVVTVKAEGLGYLTDVAVLRVALEVEGDIHTHQVVGVGNIGQAHAGADAVAEGNVPELLVFFGLLGLGCGLFVGGIRSFGGLRGLGGLVGLAEQGILFLHGLCGGGLRLGQGLFCKGRNAETGKEHRSRESEADDLFLHDRGRFLSSRLGSFLRLSNRGR